MAALLALHQNPGKISLGLRLGASCSFPSLPPSLPPPMARKHLQDCVSEQRCRLQVESNAHMKGQFSQVGKRQAATETRENVGTAPLLLRVHVWSPPRAFQSRRRLRSLTLALKATRAQETGDAQRHRNWEGIVPTSSQRLVSFHARRSTVIKYKRDSACACNASLSLYLAS